AIAALASSRSVPIVTIFATPALDARASTPSSCSNNRGSVRWQCVSITSKRRFECVFDVPNLRCLPLRPDDRDHVKARRRLGLPIAAQIKLPGLGEPIHLCGVDLLF